MGSSEEEHSQDFMDLVLSLQEMIEGSMEGEGGAVHDKQVATRNKTDPGLSREN